MKIQAFTLNVPEGHEISNGYVELLHNTQYTLNLVNSGSVRCDAEVYIDGRHVGTWRIGSNSSVCLERPVHDTGRFTFYRADTPEASKADISINAQTGLVKVIFKPESEEYYSSTEYLLKHHAGATGLSGFSDQKFKLVEPLDYNLSASVIINIRLVCPNSEPRPLFPRSNPIPPPME